MTSIPPADCWTYWGGCDPNRTDAAIRGLSEFVGFGPEESSVVLALGALVVFPVVAVVYVDPLPETLRGVAARLLAGLVAVPLTGHGAPLLGKIAAFSGIPVVWIVATPFLVAGVLFAAVGVLRTYEIVSNLRGCEP